ncbi:MAG TPA: PAS domain S-box protein [Acidimicrobiales bacterium]|nr:PAS domain S-box protein [Acidimicrobiales bacterium]
MAEELQSRVRSGDVAAPNTPGADELDSAVLWGLVEAAPDGMVVADEAGTILLVNRQTEDLFGYKRDELIGMSVEELLPEQMRRAHRAHRTRYRAEPRTRPMGAGLSLLGKRRDGTTFPVEISLSPMHSASGLRVIASVRDISERMAAEAYAREVRLVLDGLKDAVFMFDRDSLVFTYVNHGAVEQVGYRRDELLEMTPLHIAPHLTRDELGRMLAELEAGEATSRTINTVHRRRDGDDVPVEVVLQAPPPDPQGGRPPFVALVRDIRERLETEARLMEAELAVATLEDRERIARELHDTVIQRLFAIGLGLQATSGRFRDELVADRVSQAIEDLDQTIREVRGAIFGLETGHAPGAGARREVLRVVAEFERALGHRPRLSFEGAVESLPPDVVAQLVPVLREALSNVVRHAAATEVRVLVTVSGVEAEVRVEDNGVGLAAEETGVGNGLRNLAARASALGGRCEVGPGPGGGTVVAWRVPLG